MHQKAILQWATAYIAQANLSAAERSKAMRELKRYCSGFRLCHMDLPLPGTAFQRLVWRALTRVPFGKTVTYGELARRIGHPRAARAVGTALNKNPFPILFPCHRIVPSAGGIGRYAGGAARKRWLLRHERAP